jgi:hypothetical protein
MNLLCCKVLRETNTTELTLQEDLCVSSVFPDRSGHAGVGATRTAQLIQNRCFISWEFDIYVKEKYSPKTRDVRILSRSKHNARATACER